MSLTLSHLDYRATRWMICSLPTSVSCSAILISKRWEHWRGTATSRTCPDNWSLKQAINQSIDLFITFLGNLVSQLYPIYTLNNIIKCKAILHIQSHLNTKSVSQSISDQSWTSSWFDWSSDWSVSERVCFLPHLRLIFTLNRDYTKYSIFLLQLMVCFN